QPERGAVLEGLVDRPAPSFLHHRPVLLGHGARDPGDVVVGDEPAQRRDESAATPPADTLALLARIAHGPTVRDDDELATRGRHGGTLTAAAREKRDRAARVRLHAR